MSAFRFFSEKITIGMPMFSYSAKKTALGRPRFGNFMLGMRQFRKDFNAFHFLINPVLDTFIIFFVSKSNHQRGHAEQSFMLKAQSSKLLSFVNFLLSSIIDVRNFTIILCIHDVMSTLMLVIAHRLKPSCTL